MAQEQIRRTIVLNGQVGTGFEGMVAQIQAFSQVLQDVGENAAQFLNSGLKVYQNYETNMLAAQVALSAQYKDINELNKVMTQLDAAAQQWAQDTIFHTEDVSNAIVEAARAGWDLDKIMTGIPQAMLIAQAGNMDLSDGLDYLVKILNGTGSEFEDAEKIVNQWALAANSSATSIDEMGEALVAMGSSAKFADSTAELFTFIATLANVGTVGSQAGTALRNAIVRIIAPTTKAEAAMSLLGADASELEEALADTNVTKAAKTLEGLGFSAYTSSGKMKPLKQIFGELYDVTKDMNDAARNEIIAAIFPTRTIATAMALLEGAKNDYGGLYEAIMDSDGYAQSGAETMMSGLMGSVETLKSKWEEFELKVGQFTAPEVENFNGVIGGIVDRLNAFPDEVWNGFVGGMEALAVGGAIAGAVKTVVTITSMLGPWGTIALGATFATGALIGYLNELDRLNWADKFGQMDLDIQALESYMEGVHTKWDSEKEILTAWDEAISTTLKSYEEASTKLSGLLMTDVLTGKKLTPEDEKAIGDYFQAMYAAALAGIGQARAKSLSEVDLITGNENADAADFLIQLVTNNYDDLEGKMTAAGTNLGKALADALVDGVIDIDEQRAINEIVRQMNEIEAEVARTQREQDYYTTLVKAQSVSWDSASQFMKDTQAQREANIAEINAEYDAREGRLWQAFEDSYKRGDLFTDQATGEQFRITQGNYDELYQRLVHKPSEDARQAAIDSINEGFNPIIYSVLDQLMNGSDFGDAWRFMRGLKQNADGSFDFTDAFAGMNAEDLNRINQQLSELWDKSTDLLRRSGLEGEPRDVFSQILHAAGQAATEAGDWSTALFTNGLWAVPRSNATQEEISALAERYADEARIRELQDSITASYERIKELRAESASYDKEIADREAWLNGEFFNLGYSFAGPDAVRASMEGFKTTKGGIDKEIESIYNVDIAEAEVELAELQQKVAEPQTLPVTTSLDSSSIDNWDPPTKYMTVIGKPIMAYAEGGRATEPSIFGEVPGQAEWAIPEAHDDRTAELLNAARQASGFTWSELIARNGGLNGGGGGSVVIENYSPVIHAGDATGVGQVLEADKERLKKVVKDAIRESRMMDEARMYA